MKLFVGDNYMNEEEMNVVTEHNNKSFMKGALTGALSTLVLIAMVLGVRGLLGIGSSNIISSDTASKLAEIQELIDEYYLYDVDQQAVEDGMLTGYVEALGDPYSTYYNEEETLEILESTTGEYSGIGASMSQDTTTGWITIINVYTDSPAEAAGLQSGDVLVAIDGVDVSGEDVTNVVTWIKGEEGTDVDITVYPAGEYDEVTYTATRAVIEYQTVGYEMLENEIGYIGITEFDTVTLGQFEEALTDLETQEMEGLIIDLRSNLGGDLSTVCEMLELILPEGVIVSTENSEGEGSVYYSTGENEFTKPLVVLVNGYSASASEIFAAAVQDYGIGEIVGTTTYGKGVVQNLVFLSDNTIVKLTSSEYFTPLGNNIDGIGIIPDVEIEFDYDDWDTDEQLDMALEVIDGLQ